MSDCAFIKLDPIMDVEKATRLQKEFEKLAVEGKKKIYLDFSDVKFLCPYMKRVFTKFVKTWTRAGVQIGIQHISDYSKDSLKIAGLANLFTLSSHWREECGLVENEPHHHIDC